MRSLSLLVLSTLAPGCHSEPPIQLPPVETASPPPAAAPPAEAAPVPAAVVPAAPVPAAPDAPAPVEPAAVPVVAPANTTGLPPLTEPVAGRAAAAKARAENSAGYKAYKAGDLPEAARRYEAAVRADPQYILARYNLACVWNKLGDARALAVLKTFRDSGCPGCLERLTRAASDTDFADKWADPAFKALTSAVAAPKPTVADVARAVERAYLAGDHAALAPHLDGAIEMVRVCTVCDPPDDKRTHKLPAERLRAAIDAELSRHGDDDGPYFNGFEAMECKDGCCAAKRESIMHFNTYLDRVCAAPDAQGRLRLKSIEIADG